MQVLPSVHPPQALQSQVDSCRSSGSPENSLSSSMGDQEEVHWQVWWLCNTSDSFPFPNRWGRWDLKVKMGSRNVFYHRAIAFSLWPCTTAADAEGAEVEPYWVDPAWEGWWEVHHWDGDTHNNLADNLYPMWWAHHRRLTR